jgi:hypothetical protein
MPNNAVAREYIDQAIVEAAKSGNYSLIFRLSDLLNCDDYQIKDLDLLADYYRKMSFHALVYNDSIGSYIHISWR